MEIITIEELQTIYKMVAEAHNHLVKCEVKGQSVFELANAMARTQSIVEQLESKCSKQQIPMTSEILGDMPIEVANNE